MITHVLPLEFVRGQKELYDLAKAFCKAELACEIDLELLRDTWVVFQFEKDWKPIKATAIGSVVFKPDVPLCRFTDSKSGKVLVDRLMAFSADKGFVGVEAFVFIREDEAVESRCTARDEWLKNLGAEPANRFSLIVR